MGRISLLCPGWRWEAKAQTPFGKWKRGHNKSMWFKENKARGWCPTWQAIHSLESWWPVHMLKIFLSFFFDLLFPQPCHLKNVFFIYIIRKHFSQIYLQSCKRLYWMFFICQVFSHQYLSIILMTTNAWYILWFVWVSQSTWLTKGKDCCPG